MHSAQQRKKKLEKALNGLQTYLVHVPKCTDEPTLKYVADFFTPNQLEDVAVDRANYGRCGNFDCENKPTADQGASRKWKIVFGSRMVVDASLAQQFCSERCLNDFLGRSSKLSTEASHLRYTDKANEEIITVLETRRLNKAPQANEENKKNKNEVEKVPEVDQIKATDMNIPKSTDKVMEPIKKDKKSPKPKMVQFDYTAVQKPETVVQGRIRERPREADSSEDEEEHTGDKISLDSLTVVDSIFDMLSDGSGSEEEDYDTDGEDDTFEVVEVPPE